MQKKVTTMRLRDDILDFLDEIQNRTQLSRSKANELLIDIIRDYLTLDQICLEHSVRDDIDGRKKIQE